MNKELRNEIKGLESEVREMRISITKAKDFLREKGKYYKKEESIKVLSQMESLINEQEEQYQTVQKKARKMRKKFQEICPHEITIEDDLNCYCVFCHELILHETPSTILKIKLPIGLGFIGREALIHSDDEHDEKRIEDRIYEIVEGGLEQEDPLTYIEESLEELQYSSDVKVRRLKS